MADPGEIYIGLMSGTSLDAVDVCALSCGPRLSTVGHGSVPIPASLRDSLLRLSRGDPPPEGDPILSLGLARRDLTDLYANAIMTLSPAVRERANAIGAHGQTIRHHPELGFSLQILDGARLAVLTGRPVVQDFRSADIALGGQGAPLVPAFHEAAFGGSHQTSAIINIGGIANITVLGSDISSTPGILAGFDTGPGNRLLDDWCLHCTGQHFDRDGQWGASGLSHQPLLNSLLAAAYFGRQPPKSTGREDFNIGWLLEQIAQHAPAVSAVDIQSTLVELTARTIADAVTAYRAQRVLLCGGGAANVDLVRRITEAVHPARCATTACLDIDPQLVEAAAFAWLAMRRMNAQVGNAPQASGASQTAILGSVHLPPP